MTLERRVSGVHPLKEPGYPSLAVCLLTSAMRSTLRRHGPMTAPQLSAYLGVNLRMVLASVTWMRSWDWATWDGERLVLLTPADTLMRKDSLQ